MLRNRADSVEFISSNIKSAGNVVTFRHHMKTYLLYSGYPPYRPIACFQSLTTSALPSTTITLNPLVSCATELGISKNIGVVQVTCLFITASVSSVLLVLRLCLVRLPRNTSPHIDCRNAMTLYL